MSRRLNILTIFVLTHMCALAQDYDRCWPLGSTVNTGLHDQANLIFAGNTVSIDSVIRDIHFSNTCASISDSVGKMLFFSNGCVIGNALNDTMVDGDSLNPGQCGVQNCLTSANVDTRANIILPDLTNPNRFIIFHLDCNYNTNWSPISLYTSIVDLSLDSGRGEVVSKSVLLLRDTLCDGSLAAVKHANGTDWWIILHEKNSNRFIRYMYNALGISGPYVQSIGPLYDNDSHGNSRFSPDGHWFATSAQLGGVELYRFDRCSGLLYDRTYLDFPDTVWSNSVEFSPNSRFLYTFGLYWVSQFDLFSSNISTSGQQVAVYDNFVYNTSHTWFFQPQLAPNGKIYCCSLSSVYLHIIDRPDSLGSACNVLQHALITPSITTCLPNLPNYRLGAEDSLYCDTINSISLTMEALNPFQIFPNPTNGNLKIVSNRINERLQQVSVYDFSSRLVLEEKVHPEEINMEAFSNGIYLISIITNMRQYFSKVVVEH